MKHTLPLLALLTSLIFSLGSAQAFDRWTVLHESQRLDPAVICWWEQPSPPARRRHTVERGYDSRNLYPEWHAQLQDLAAGYRQLRASISEWRSFQEQLHESMQSACTPQEYRRLEKQHELTRQRLAEMQASLAQVIRSARSLRARIDAVPCTTILIDDYENYDEDACLAWLRRHPASQGLTLQWPPAVKK